MVKENSTLFESSGVTSKFSTKDYIRICWITFDICWITFDICRRIFDIGRITFDICRKTFDICWITFDIADTPAMELLLQPACHPCDL